MRLRAVRRRLPVIAVVLAVAVSFPLGVIASHQFSDVQDTSPYHADIDAIAEVGVTTGCGGGEYCPDDFVTREQMAAFLNRLGALGPDKKAVVNAAHAEEADVAVTAGDSDTLDGRDSSDFLGDGAIVVHQGGIWEEFLSSQFTITPGFSWTNVAMSLSGDATAVIELRGPGVISGKAYALQSVEFCYGDTVDVSIVSTSAWFGDVNTQTEILDDATDRAMTTDACYTVQTNQLVVPNAPVKYFLDLEWVDNTVARFGRVTSTWVVAG